MVRPCAYKWGYPNPTSRFCRDELAKPQFLTQHKMRFYRISQLQVSNRVECILNLFTGIPIDFMDMYQNPIIIPYHFFQQELEDLLQQPATPILLQQPTTPIIPTQGSQLVCTVKKQGTLLMIVLHKLDAPGMPNILKRTNKVVRSLEFKNAITVQTAQRNKKCILDILVWTLGNEQVVRVNQGVYYQTVCYKTSWHCISI